MLEKFKDLNLNEIGQTVQKYLDEHKLTPKGHTEFRLLNGKPNADPNRFDGDMIYNSSVGIPLNGIILDPDNGPVQIAVVKNINPVTELPVFQKFTISLKRKDGGRFALHGNRVEDVRFHDALLLSNYNASNPFRDAAVIPIFEMIDSESESANRSKKRHYLRDCLNAIDSWTKQELIAMGASHGFPSVLGPSVIKDKLEALAEKDPITFYKLIDTEETAIRGIIQLAKEKNYIGFNAVEKKWFFTRTSETIALLPRKEGVSEIAQFADFLKNSPNGPAIRKNLEKMLSNKAT